MVKLPRAPGAREARWAHLLCGDVALSAAPQQESGSEIEALRAEQARLAARLDELSELVERIAAELGIDQLDLQPEARPCASTFPSRRSSPSP